MPEIAAEDPPVRKLRMKKGKNKRRIDRDKVLVSSRPPLVNGSAKIKFIGVMGKGLFSYILRLN